MVLGRFFRYVTSKWSAFRKWLFCKAIVCVENHQLMCRMVFSATASKCLLHVSMMETWKYISREEAEKMRNACIEMAREKERKCLEIHRECCG